MSNWDIYLAGPDDWKDIADLQAKPMPGPIRFSIRREPEPGEDIVIARKEGKLMGMGARARRPHFWSGHLRVTGVLSGLRSNCGLLPRRTMAEMYRMLRIRRAFDEPDWDLTAILDSNITAKRLLEVGLPGFPKYSPLVRMVTFTFSALPSPRHPEKMARANTSGETMQANLDVKVGGNTASVACITSRHTVVTGYTGWTQSLRWGVNAGLRLIGLPILPRPGTHLSEAFLFASDSEGIYAMQTKQMRSWVQAIRQAAAELGASVLHWGMPLEQAKRLDLLRSIIRTPAIRTFSTVYAVHDPAKPPPTSLGLLPEVARL